LPPPAAFSPDGSVLALADLVRNVQLFDARTGTPRGHPIATHRGVIFGIAFSPDAKTIAATSCGQRFTAIHGAAVRVAKRTLLRHELPRVDATVEGFRRHLLDAAAG
jgi:WD40 repeat protein